jgi:hypothetical protein
VIDLTALPLWKMSPVPLRLGATVKGPLGGSIRINRLGDRWSWLVETTNIALEPDGRRWASLIAQAEREGALLAIAQPRLAVGAPGLPTVAAQTIAGRSVPLAGLSADYTIRQGQWVTVIAGGARYADRAAAQVVASSGGTATVVLENLIRAPLPAGTTVEIGRPKCEGDVFDVSEHVVDVDEVSRFTFRIEEAA